MLMSSKLKTGTTNANNLVVLSCKCEVNEVLRNISTRWKMPILHSIARGTQQFSLLKNAFPSLSDQILGKRLSELVADQLIDKTILEAKAPMKIIYSPTVKGMELLQIIDDLHKWGIKW
jgi:DNA-binding HxlR family transcriptional regulator